MSFPDYEELADALLCFIFLNGGETHQVRSGETYNPLADFFDLPREERTRPRPDGYSGSQWQNRVQWTRQRLINDGDLERRGRGNWGLTPSGISRAQSIAHSYDKLEQDG